MHEKRVSYLCEKEVLFLNRAVEEALEADVPKEISGELSLEKVLIEIHCEVFHCAHTTFIIRL